MKKLVPLLLASAAAVAYLVVKNRKEEKEEEIKIISLENDDESAESSVENQDTFTEVEQEPEVEYPEESLILKLQYPSLELSFIDEVLKYSENFNTEHPIDSHVCVNHVAKFERAESMIEFVKCIQESNYTFQEAAEENTLLVMRNIDVTEGALLEEVLRISNLVNSLSGEYFGFRIDNI